MNTPGNTEPYPRRRDIRTGAADPVPPTGMIPVIPLVEKPSGDPMPTRKELRTGMIQTAPATKAEPARGTPKAEPSGESQGNTAAQADPKPHRRGPWLAAVAAAAVACAILSWFLLAP